jgi:hypothetical protein
MKWTFVFSILSLSGLLFAETLNINGVQISFEIPTGWYSDNSKQMSSGDLLELFYGGTNSRNAEANLIVQVNQYNDLNEFSFMKNMISELMMTWSFNRKGIYFINDDFENLPNPHVMFKGTLNDSQFSFYTVFSIYGHDFCISMGVTSRENQEFYRGVYNDFIKGLKIMR